MRSHARMMDVVGVMTFGMIAMLVTAALASFTLF